VREDYFLYQNPEPQLYVIGNKVEIMETDRGSKEGDLLNQELRISRLCCRAAYA